MQTSTTIRILFVEDNEADYELTLATLARDGFAVKGIRVEDENAMRAALDNNEWDAVISDHHLPHFSSFAALATMRGAGLDLPFLVVSGESGEELAVETMLAGADDYIMKSRLKRLSPALRRSLEASRMRKERAAALQALRESEARLHELAGHRAEAIEEERKTIAMELHDAVGGALTSLKFDLSWLDRHARLEPPHQARLQNALATLDSTVEATQRLVIDLRPAVLDQGIVAALEWQTREFVSRTSIDARFSANLDAGTDNAVSIALYRVCQEALTNVTKHATAKAVEVNLFFDDEEVHLEVSDDGKGFDASQAGGKRSFGLVGMRDRARQLGGTLEISSATGRGTTMMLTLPLDKAAAGGLS